MKRKAYAKINLILDVLNKREDGFHEIDFLMTTVNIFDEVEIIQTSNNEDFITVNNFPQLANSDNLAFKALQLMKSRFNLTNCYAINIQKNIPIAAGMAGGSGDAAAVFHLINDLENLNLSNAKLADIGATLGSDIPFCIYEQLARAGGKGEKIETYSMKLIPSNLLVINPGFELSTAEVYNNHKISNMNLPKKSITDILNLTTYDEFYSNLRNDLEITACNLDTRISTLINDISQFDTFTKIMVSGSGPTVLIFDKDIEKLQRAYSHYSQIYDNVFLTNTR